ncbi:hypothetical protein SELMODRAFT_447786 [Selaginella moellendorffii]|uniref:Uncharacterized protein n=1 Tax=Selaginella moellendorffii TaxID=88036 RepID=D8T2A4_SELML|nr:uncharacterized protein LOC9638126 [Selaginella moellendorffii]XP_024519222.1 uncharacterized protein LOC9638126 [Selaginella moellendorffii]EFJ09174.1 hypothetical protein SELMODRAFT_447786 [Selaginella moellendorffii]|eukprot:XP_002989697.1 uncharacterized protein LOC9638126 [Selaginella moellendorffii]
MEVARESQRRKLFWVDDNAVALFYLWLHGPAGKRFEHIIHDLYRRCGIAPLYPSFLEELHHFASMPSISIDKVRHDIWELAASENFPFFGAAFVRLALSLCRYADPGTGVAHDWCPTACFSNRPAFKAIMSLLVAYTSRDVPYAPHSDHILEEMYAMLCHVKPSTIAAVETQAETMVELPQPCDAFDVTEMVCRLFYTWLLVAKHFYLVQFVKHHLDKHFIAPSKEVGDRSQGLTLPPELAGTGILCMLQLALSFVFNVTSSSQAVPLSSSDVEQLEAWVRFRGGMMQQGDNPFTPVACIPVTFVEKMIEAIKDSCVDLAQAAADCSSSLWGDRCSHMVALVELHTSVVELDFASNTVARLFHSWLRCQGGQSKHRAMVEHINMAYNRLGWPPCTNSSLLQEVKSGLADDDNDRVAAKCDIWMQSLPRRMQSLRLERSFVNLLAAVSLQGEAEEEEEFSWMLLDEIRSRAAAGGYQMLKPRLPVVENGDEGGVNEVIYYLVEELRFWKRMEVSGGAVCPYGTDEGYDFTLPTYSRADLTRDFKLPGASREIVEHHLFEPTIALCRDVTQPVLRLLAAWQQHKRGQAGASKPSADLDDKALQSLVCCSQIRGASNTSLSERDVAVCKDAASDDLRKVVAVVTGKCELGPLLHKMLELEGEQEQEQEMLSKQLGCVGLG